MGLLILRKDDLYAFYQPADSLLYYCVFLDSSLLKCTLVIG